MTPAQAQHLADAAFARALAQGRLSRDPTAPNYQHNYMFMGTHPKRGDAFKHRETRRYLPDHKEGDLL